MLWWFERDGDYFSLEVAYRPDGTYELRFLSPDGATRVEIFRSASDLANRQHRVKTALLARGWARANEWTL